MENTAENHVACRKNERKGWAAALILAILCVSATLWLVLMIGEKNQQGRNVEQWQAAYAEMVANSGDCGGVAVAQKILLQEVSGWPKLTEEEANVVFADWRGDMRGGLIAPLLRHHGVEGDYHEVITNDEVEASNDAEWRDK